MKHQQHLDDVTCVEAATAAFDQAGDDLPGSVTFMQGLFETLHLPRRCDRIVLTHVMNHLDDPVGVMCRINTQWLWGDGQFFPAGPNADALSRQIAVKMGLIPHKAAITPGEEAHGHRIPIVRIRLSATQLPRDPSL